MEEIPVEPRLGHCGCRVLVGRVHLPSVGAGAVTEHGVQRQGRNNRKNPTSSAGNGGKLWELSVAPLALPDTSNSLWV